MHARMMALVVTAALLVPRLPCAALTLVASGKSAYTIVVPDDAGAPVEYAATELQEYVRRITGVTLPRAAVSAAPDGPKVYLGVSMASAAAGLEEPEPEHFVVRAVGRDLFIVGGDEGTDPIGTFGGAVTGTANGVFELLRRFAGVRWLWPGELGTVVPSSERFEVPDDLAWTDGPDFRIRNLWLTYGNPAWVRKEYAAWYRHTLQGQALSGHSGHAYRRLLGGNAHFDTHPEYYALVGGTRRAFHGRGQRAGQICTSNQEVVRISAENAAALERDITSLSPNDGSGFCECEVCRALDVPESTMAWAGGRRVALTDRIFTFVNQVAALVRARKPQQLCGHYCYTFFKQPPARIPALEDNVLLFFAQACHWFRDPEVKAAYRGYIDAWARYGNPMVSREYYGLIYWHGLPNVHTRLIEEDIKYLQAKGFIGVNSEMCRDFATHGPNYYLAARLLWDVDGTRAEVLDEYYQAGFGAAAGEVAEVYDIFERRLAELGAEASGTGSRNINRLPRQFDAETVAAARAAFDRACAKAESAATRARLDFVRIGLEYTDVTSRLIALLQRLNAAGMSFYPLEAAPIERQPTPQEYIEMVKEAKALHDRRWELIRSQDKLPALHTPAFEEQEKRSRWGEQLASQADILADEAGRYLALPLSWRFRVETAGAGESAGWHRADFDAGDWGRLRTNQPWEKQGYEDFDGVGWYRVAVNVPPEKAASERVVLRFGAVDESCRAWLNGEKIGEFTFDVEKDESSWRKPLDFDVTGRLRPGRNVVALRVEDRLGLGGLWKPSYLIFDREPPNLLQNGSFESDTAPWSLRGTAGTRHERVGARGFESTHSLKVTVAAGENVHWQASQTVAVPADARCKFSFRYLTAGVGEHPEIKRSPAIRVIFLGANGKSLTDTKGYFWGAVSVPADTAEWQEASLFFKTLPETTKVSITLFLHRPGSYWLDALALRELE